MSLYIALRNLITFLQQFGLLSCFKTLQVIGVLPLCYLENRDNNSSKITKRQEFCSCRKTDSGMEKPHKHRVYAESRWRKRWDSNPRAREDYLISSQARYDHFDTLPYLVLILESAKKCDSKCCTFDLSDNSPCMLFCKSFTSWETKLTLLHKTLSQI